MRWKALLAIGTALIVIVSWTAIRGRAALPATDKATEKLAIRQIGHQLLLQAGDSSSRILPEPGYVRLEIAEKAAGGSTGKHPECAWQRIQAGHWSNGVLSVSLLFAIFYQATCLYFSKYETIKFSSSLWFIFNPFVDM
jgi:hypothetical protein